MKTTYYTLSLLIFTLFIGLSSTAATCSSIASGSWFSAATWSCGRVPACGDYISITTGHTVTIDAQVNLSEASGCSTASFISVGGTLNFVTGTKIRLACGSGVEILPGGSMNPGGGGGSSNLLEICGATEWKTSDGPATGPDYFGAPQPLSSEFTSFNVLKVESRFQLNWVISSAFDISSYNIYLSEDGINWELEMSIASVGNHMDEQSYNASMDDKKLTEGLRYFKLAQVNNEGEIKDLSTISYFNSSVNLMIYPNPLVTENEFMISIQSDKKENYIINLTNAQGQVITEYNLIIEEGQNSYTIDASTLESGVYFIQSNKYQQTQRLVINK